MARIIKIKNTKETSDVWVGQTIAPSEYFTISASALSDWQENAKVFTDVASGDLVINNGDMDFTKGVEGWDWLHGNKRDVAIESESKVTWTQLKAF